MGEYSEFREFVQNHGKVPIKNSLAYQAAGKKGELRGQARKFLCPAYRVLQLLRTALALQRRFRLTFKATEA